MIIPKYLQRPNMTESERKELETWIEQNRKAMRKAPTFQTVEEATKNAVQTYKETELSLPSVWKEPEDIGTNYAIVIRELREKALIGGYKKTVDVQEIVDIALGRIDEIEEV